MTDTDDESDQEPDPRAREEDTAVAVLPGGTTSDAVTDAGSGGAGEPRPRRRRPDRRAVLTFGSGVLAGALVLALVAIFIWPGHLFGPGSPDSVASQATTALGAKDRPTTDRLSCRGPDGASVVSGDILNVISAAKPAGPAKIVIDTEAHAPVDLTVSFQGQSQTLPVDLVLGVSHGAWCFKAITQRS
jgi:hypothetical protein